MEVELVSETLGIHADRVAGRDRDHQRADRFVAARGSIGSRDSPPRPVR